MKRIVRHTTCALGITFIVSTLALGQQNVGGITGSVMDPSGAVIPSVHLAALREQTGQTFETTTNASGLYTLTLLPIGTYTITADAAGFRKLERRGVAVVSGETATVDLRMEVGAVTQTTTVTAETPPLDTTSSIAATTRTSDEISQLPVTLTGQSSRTALGFAMTLSGVAPVPAGGAQQFLQLARSSINGSVGATYGYLIDGVDAGMGEEEPASDFISPIPEQIGEMRLTTNSDASSGFNGGITIEMTQKSGTNQIHGSTFYYNRNDALEARSFFDTTGKPVPTNRARAGRP